MNARTVPIGMPLEFNTSTRGMMPAALEYSGTPIATATSTPNGLSELA